MVYRVNDRLDYLGTRRKVIDSETCIYRRGSSTVEINASLGHTDAQEIIPSVSITQVREQDFIFDTEDLIISGAPAKPQHGDEIIRPNDGLYRVVSRGDNEPPWKFTTPSEKRIRVHTDYIGTSPRRMPIEGGTTLGVEGSGGLNG